MEQEARATFIGVPNPSSDPDDIDEWIADVAPQITHVRADLREIWRDHEVLTQPAFIFVGSDGEVVEKFNNSGGRTGLLWRVQDLIDPSIRG